MTKLSLFAFCFVVVVQVFFAQSADVHISPGVDLFSLKSIRRGSTLGSAASSSREEELFLQKLSDNELDEAYHKVLSRTKRGFRSSLSRAWKKHLRPILSEVLKEQGRKIVRRIVKISG
ncbi:hypothetical protein FHG87_000003 [Trinorchestia longiramus]|nr:hypothetical protein FHG87_000003 [Trinorchestia longiramus]